MKTLLSALLILAMMVTMVYALLIGFADQAGMTRLEERVEQTKQAMEAYHARLQKLR